MASGVYRDGVARLAPRRSKILYHADGKTATVSVIETRTAGCCCAPTARPTRRCRSTATRRRPTSRRRCCSARSRSAPIRRRSAPRSSASARASRRRRCSRRRRSSASTRSRSSGAWSTVRSCSATAMPRRGRDERSHFVFDDAKAWLARSHAPCDIVVSEPSNPWVSGVASLFTAETYERIAKHLAPGGVLVQWIQVYEIDGALLSSIFRALVAHFPHYVVYKGGPGDLIVVASRERHAGRRRRVAVQASRARGAAEAGRRVASPADIDGRWRGDNRVYQRADGRVRRAGELGLPPVRRPERGTHAFRAGELPAAVRREPRAVADARGARRPVPANVRQREIRSARRSPTALVAPADANVLAAGSLRGLCRRRARDARALASRASPADRSRCCSKARSARRSRVNELPAQRARAVWAAIREGACYRTMDAEAQLWVDLFAAVGARDASGDVGARHARARNGAERVHARLRAECRGRRRTSRSSGRKLGGRLLELHPPSQETPWTMILREATAGKTIAAEVQ